MTPEQTAQILEIVRQAMAQQQAWYSQLPWAALMSAVAILIAAFAAWVNGRTGKQNEKAAETIQEIKHSVNSRSDKQDGKIEELTRQVVELTKINARLEEQKMAQTAPAPPPANS